MPYTISARCEIGTIQSRRVQARRAVKQARDYHRRGYTDIAITDVLTGEKYDANSLAAMSEARLAGNPGEDVSA